METFRGSERSIPGWWLPAIAGTMSCFAFSARGQCGAVWVSGVGSPGVNGTIDAIAVLPNGDVVVGGDFSRAGVLGGSGDGASNIARYRPSTGQWFRMGAGANRTVQALHVMPDGDLLVGGSFTTMAGTGSLRIARYRPSTDSWIAVGVGLNNPVYDFATLGGDDVVVVGAFSTAGGVAANRVARLQPSVWRWTSIGAGTNGLINEAVVLADGDVVVGGGFTSAGGQSGRNRIASFRPATNEWFALGEGRPGEVECMVLARPDLLLVGNRSSSGSMARYDLTSGIWSLVGGGVSGPSPLTYPNAFELLPSGEVLVGGNFSTAGGMSARNIAIVDPVTTSWRTLPLGTDGPVRALALDRDGGAYIGGNFATAGGVGAGAIAYISIGGPPVVIDQPEDVLACENETATFEVAASGRGERLFRWRKDGQFLDANSVPSAVTPRLTVTVLSESEGVYDCVVSNNCGQTASSGGRLVVREASLCCPADFNGDGFIDFFDFSDFVDAFERGAGLEADFNLDGFVDFFDYSDFVLAFETGC